MRAPLILLIILVFLTSCHKKPALPTGLTGKWVLAKSGNGDSLRYAFRSYVGPSRILQVQPDRKYSWYKSFSVVESGTYSLSPGDTTGGILSNMVITFTHDNISYKKYYLLASDRALYFYDYNATTSLSAILTQEYYQKIY